LDKLPRHESWAALAREACVMIMANEGLVYRSVSVRKPKTVDAMWSRASCVFASNNMLQVVQEGDVESERGTKAALSPTRKDTTEKAEYKKSFNVCQYV